jgi:hypothetical protein
MKFETNVGSTDRMVRIVVGALLVLLAIAGLVGVWGYIGVIPLVSGLMRTCPAYSLLGINTCGKSAT